MGSPVIGEELRRLHERHAADRRGALATYIPELAKAEPDWFGISLCTIDGSVHEAGDSRQEFTIQSVSKPFVFALALADNDIETVLTHVGMEPSGDAFNSIVLDREDRPHNPMVNAGAIATVGLVRASSPEERFERILAIMSAFAGRDLVVDEAVYASERLTGHRNRAIGHLLRTVGALVEDVEDVLDAYFRQCSVRVTAVDLAVMAATLANGGRNPLTGRTVVSPVAVADVLSVMFTAGMYDYSGEWAYRTGLPAKSGVSGGVTALVPGQLGVGAFSPLVDRRGNSVRGVGICEEFSRRLGFHLFRGQTEMASPIREIASATERRSVRVRSTAQTSALDVHGHRIGVVETQGPWTFVACERFMRAVDEIQAEFLVVETSRMGFVDATARVLMSEFVCHARAAGRTVVFAGVVPSGFRDAGAEVHTSIDSALEWCEDELLSRVVAVESDLHLTTIAQSDLALGLGGAQIECLEAVGVVCLVGAGEVVARVGEPSSSMFLVTSGHLTAMVEGERVAAFGPGAMIGEMGFLTANPRSATVRADVASTLVEFASFDGLPPELRERLYKRIAVVLAGRLGATTKSLVASIG